MHVGVGASGVVREGEVDAQHSEHPLQTQQQCVWELQQQHTWAGQHGEAVHVLGRRVVQLVPAMGHVRQENVKLSEAGCQAGWPSPSSIRSTSSHHQPTRTS